MEDKRTALALLICILVIMVYSEVFIRPLQQTQQPAVESSQQATPNTGQTATPLRTGAQFQSTPQGAVPHAESAAVSGVVLPHPTSEEISGSPATEVVSGKVLLKIAHLGARISTYRLLDYRAHLNAPDTLDLVSHVEGAPLPGGVYVGTINDERVNYQLSQVSAGAQRVGDSLEIPAGGELSLTFTGTLPGGLAISKTFKFGPHPYLFSLSVRLDREASSTSRIWLEWPLYLSKAQSSERINPGGFSLFSENKKLSHVALTDVSSSPTDFGANRWVSLADKYFMATVIPQYIGTNTRLGRDGDVYFSRVAGENAEAEFGLYVGPKVPAMLESAGFDLGRNVDLGIFAPVSYPLLAGIRFFYSIFHNYGVAIILLTLLIKFLFLPLTKASMESMRKMQDLQPEMNALRERIKDATELNKAVVELYRKRGVNPLGGCLPIMIQLPVFLGLYNALMYSIELRHAHYALWINDLSDREVLHLFSVPVPIMVLIMGASMYFQQLTSPQVGDPQQQRIMRMMPIIFTAMFLIFPVPAGLTLYWLVNNIISIIQQMYLRGHRKANPYVATLVASCGIFAVGYVLTLL